MAVFLFPEYSISLTILGSREEEMSTLLPRRSLQRASARWRGRTESAVHLFVGEGFPVSAGEGACGAVDEVEHGVDLVVLDRPLDGGLELFELLQLLRMLDSLAEFRLDPVPGVVGELLHGSLERVLSSLEVACQDPGPDGRLALLSESRLFCTLPGVVPGVSLHHEVDSVPGLLEDLRGAAVCDHTIVDVERLLRSSLLVVRPQVVVANALRLVGVSVQVRAHESGGECHLVLTSVHRVLESPSEPAPTIGDAPLAQALLHDPVIRRDELLRVDERRLHVAPLDLLVAASALVERGVDRVTLLEQGGHDHGGHVGRRRILGRDAGGSLRRRELRDRLGVVHLGLRLGQLLDHLLVHWQRLVVEADREVALSEEMRARDVHDLVDHCLGEGVEERLAPASFLSVGGTVVPVVVGVVVEVGHDECSLVLRLSRTSLVVTLTSFTCGCAAVRWLNSCNYVQVIEDLLSCSKPPNGDS